MESYSHLKELNKVWKSMDELRGDLEKTDLALKMAFRKHPIGDNQQGEALRVHSGSSRDGDNYLKERRWRKRKIYSRLKGSHLLHQQIFEDFTAPEQNGVSRMFTISAQMPSPYPEPSIKKPPAKSEFIRPTVSHALLMSHEDISVASSESIKTDSGTSTVHPKRDGAFRAMEKGRSATVATEQSKIRFSKWEKEFLNKEMPDIQVPESRNSSSDISQTYVKLPAAKSVTLSKPLFASVKPPEQLRRLKDVAGYKELKDIIAKQKKRKEKILAEIADDPFLEDGVSNGGKLPTETAVPKIDASTNTRTLPMSNDVEVQVGLIRKVSTAPSPKIYKGFSPLRSQVEWSPSILVPQKPLTSTLIQTISPRKSPTKLTRKTCVVKAREKDYITPFSWREGEKLCRDVLGPPPCIILNDKERFVPRLDLSSSSNRSSPTRDVDREPTRDDELHKESEERSQNNNEHPLTEGAVDNVPHDVQQEAMPNHDAHTGEGNPNETIDLTESPPLNTSELRNEDKENASPSIDEHLVAVRKILEDLQNEDSDNEIVISELSPSNTPKQSRKFHSKIIRSKKRKAMKQPETKPPAAKVRHYNREQVRQYIEKQKLTRKKKLLEERQKKQQAEQVKKERLQHLYEYQKLAASKSKSSQPLKLLHENVKVTQKGDSNESRVTSPHHTPTKSLSNKTQSPKKKNDMTTLAVLESDGIEHACGATGELNIAETSDNDECRVQKVCLDHADQNEAQLEKFLEVDDEGMTLAEKVISESNSKLKTRTVATSTTNLVDIIALTDSSSGRLQKLDASELSHDVLEQNTSSFIKCEQAKRTSKKSLTPKQSVAELLPKVLSKIEGKMGEMAKERTVSSPLPTYRSDNGSFSQMDDPRITVSDKVNVNDIATPQETSSHSLSESNDERRTTKESTDAKEQILLASREEKSKSDVLQNDEASRHVSKSVDSINDDVESLPAYDNRKNVTDNSMAYKQYLSNVEQSAKDFIASLGRDEPIPKGSHEWKSSTVMNIQTAKELLVQPQKQPVDSLPKSIKSEDALLLPLAARLSTLEQDFSHLFEHDPFNFINTFKRKPLVLHYPADRTENKVEIEIAQANKSFSSSDLKEMELSTSKESYSSRFSISEEEVKSSDSRPSDITTSKSKLPTSPSVVSVQQKEDPVDVESGSTKYESFDGSVVPSVNSLPSQVIEGSLSDELSEQDLSETSGELTVEKSKNRGNSTGHLDEEISTSMSSSERTLTEAKTCRTPVDNIIKTSNTDGDNPASNDVVENTSDDIEDDLKMDSESPSESKPVTDQSRSASQLDVESYHSTNIPVSETSAEPSVEVEENVQSVHSVEASEGEEIRSSSSPVLKSSPVETDSKSAHQRKEKAPPTQALVQPTTLLDAGCVTRVVAEAASAAATSAVIAALEYQKLLPSKKQLLEIMDRRTSPSRKEYSPDFESSKGSGSLSAVSHHSQSTVKSGKVGSSLSQSVQSIEELVPSPESDKSPVSSEPRTTHSRTVDNSALVVITEGNSNAFEGSSGEKSSLIEEEVEENINAVEKKKKRSENVSSPSPASLSDNESLPSTSVSTTASSLSHVSQRGGDLEAISGEESFAELTLDMVRRMTYEEELRARHQLSLLEFQEKALVEKARAEMKWLELLKKKLQEKHANDKLPVIRKRQHELILRLRQERAQLRCMQETYRSVSQKRHALLAEKKKLLTEPSSLAFQILRKKESSMTSLDKSSEKVSPSASMQSILSVTSGDPSVTETKSPVDVPEVVVGPSSSVESAESPNTSLSKGFHNPLSKPLNQPQSTLSRAVKSDSTAPPSSHPASYSLESDLKGVKRLEANKRYLNKKEQRLVQRKSQVEGLLQWQKKLDQEEKELRILEQKAVEAIEKNKHRSRYYISTSSLSSAKTEGVDDATETKTLSNTVPKESLEPDVTSTPSERPGSELLESSSVPEEGVLSASPDGGREASDKTPVPSIISYKTSVPSEHNGTTASRSSSVVDQVALSHTSSPSTVGDEVSPSKLSITNPAKNHSSSSMEVYSDSFISASGTPNSSTSPAQIKDAGTPSLKKRLNSSTRSLFTSPRHRRQDSSGSDDSFTISHSETASDQSDIEGRIYALTEELKQRRAEAEKLRREQKKHHFEQLREKELSLRKQLEAYDKYIMEASKELEQQLEAVSSRDSSSPSITVKPQIKQPRVAKSRHLQKQSHVLIDSEHQNKNLESADHGTVSDGKGVPLLPKERKPQSSSHLAKKLRAIETKEVSEDISTQLSSSDSTTTPKSIKSETSSSSPVETKRTLSKPSSKSDTPEDGGNGSRALSQAGTEVSSSYSPDVVASEESLESISTRNGDVRTAESSLTEAEDSVSGDADGGKSEQVSLDETLKESETSVLSIKTLQKKNSDSTESESFESVVEEEVEEDAAPKSESEECSGSNGCPSPQKVLDATFIVNDEFDITTNTLDSYNEVDEPAEVYKQPNEFQSSPNSSKNAEPKRNELNKNELVDTIVNDVLRKLCEDVANTVCTLVQRHRVSVEIPSHDIPVDTFEVSPHKTWLPTSLTSVHERVAEKVSETVTNNLLKDAVVTILKVFKKMKLDLSESDAKGKPLLETSVDDSDAHVVGDHFGYTDSVQSTNPSVDCIVDFPEDLKSVQLESTSSIVKNNIDQIWFDTGGVASNKSPLPPLDQQLFIRQYPYYYRQIPNKPPPPYTPPSTPLTHIAQTSASKPEVKVVEKINVLQEAANQLNDTVEGYVDIILKEKANGTALQDVKLPQDKDDVEDLDLPEKSRKIFQTFLFELTKEIALNLYMEDKSQIKYRPWLRNQNLTQKPIFPMDKEVILPRVLTEIRKILKLDSTFKLVGQSMWSAMKLGRKKRDFVDTIIISELKEEEPEWVCYDDDEFAVKLQLTDSIFDLLLNDAVSVVKNVLSVQEEDPNR